MLPLFDFKLHHVVNFQIIIRNISKPNREYDLKKTDPKISFS
jgi:hypothetical protein